jgi:hypothetical protein
LYLFLTHGSRAVGLSVHLLRDHRLSYAECDDDDCHDFGPAREEDMIVYVGKLVVGVMIALKLRKLVAIIFEALGCRELDYFVSTLPRIAPAVAVLFCDLSAVVVDADSNYLGKRLLQSFLGVWP